MSDSFNGYHVWLGIPPSEQPPNHYRLLGIPIFETDPDVIDHAADRQMAHVRTFQSGRNGPLSQRILNELASARVCLLHPARKAEYDDGLRAKLSTAARVAMPVAKAVPVTPVAAPRATPQRSQATQTAPAPEASPLDDDGYEVESMDLARLAEPMSDDGEGYGAASDLVSSGPAIKIRGGRRRFDGDQSLQKMITWLLIGVAVLVLVMVLFGIARRLASGVNWSELFTMPQGVVEETVDGAETKKKAPPPPVPGSHTEP